MDYLEIKNKISENKQKIVLVACFLLVFLIGFGTGRFDRSVTLPRAKVQNNYSIQPPAEPIKNTAAQPPAAVAGTSTAAATAGCIVKGNISSAGKKIYHVKGGAFYDRTNPEQCFNSEAEALAAGFVKSSR